MTTCLVHLIFLSFFSLLLFLSLSLSLSRYLSLYLSLSFPFSILPPSLPSSLTPSSLPPLKDVLVGELWMVHSPWGEDPSSRQSTSLPALTDGERPHPGEGQSTAVYLA